MQATNGSTTVRWDEPRFSDDDKLMSVKEINGEYGHHSHSVNGMCAFILPPGVSSGRVGDKMQPIKYKILVKIARMTQAITKANYLNRSAPNLTYLLMKKQKSNGDV